ncbi:MAG: molybdopterin-dependent oxidoreductase [Planctomycetota bacterium]
MSQAPLPDDPRMRGDLRRMTRRAFAFGGIAAIAGVGGLSWLQTRSAVQGLPWPFRWGLAVNETVGRALFSPTHLAPEFDPSMAGEPRVNGRHGWSETQPTAADWRLTIEAPGQPIRALSLADLGTVPRSESTTELKCVEGWSQIVHWGGWRLADVLTAYGFLPPAGSPLQYLRLATFDGGYTSALDLPSALHPQTILCDSMNGAPLAAGHGAPLRLALPVKYGIKNIKWLAHILFQADRPTDYWTDRGYDWFAGL